MLKDTKGKVISMMKATLNGTEKQIAWAESIRENVIASYIAWFDNDENIFEETHEGARDVMCSLYNGITRYQAPMDIPTSYAMKVYLETREAHKDAKIAEIDEIAADYISNAIDEANAAFKALKETDREAAKIARAKVYKKYAKIFFEYSIKNETSAAAWIDTFKGTRHAR